MSIHDRDIEERASIIPPVNSTEPRYMGWITEWRKNHRQKNACYSATHDIAKEFPELKLCRGWAHYKYDLSWQKGYECWDQHWWCEAPDGTIVDPTNEQWLDERGGVVTGYEKYDVKFHGPEPIGKCMGCGSIIYPEDYDGSTSFCSKDCEDSTRSYYGI